MIKRIINLQTIDSTQNAAKELAQQNFPGGTLIVAQTQTSGRGQFERKWDSQKGGLYFSLLLRPGKKITQASAFTIKAAEVVVEILKQYGLSAKIKHPNDVLAYDKKKKKFLKICGILTEVSSSSEVIEWAVVGIGININNNLDKNIEATSIKKLLGKEVDAEEFKETFFNLLSLRYEQWLMSCIS